jgi:hypothetical protein
MSIPTSVGRVQAGTGGIGGWWRPKKRGKYKLGSHCLHCQGVTEECPFRKWVFLHTADLSSTQQVSDPRYCPGPCSCASPHGWGQKLYSKQQVSDLVPLLHFVGQPKAIP